MSTRSPRLTIGMPVYNGENYLPDALDSILAQTFEDFELIISDNASSDGTQRICRAYAARDERIRYFRNSENIGGAANFNRVVQLARGEYFRWACHDDVLEPECIQACVEVLDEEPLVVLSYPLTIVIDEHGSPVNNPKHLRSLHLRSPEPHERLKGYFQQFRYGGKCDILFGVMRTEVLRRTAMIGSYPSSDRILLAELSLHGEFHEVRRPLFRRRDHPRTSMRAYRTMKERMAWFDPKRAGTVFLPEWQWTRGYVAAINRAQLSAAERARCLLVLMTGYGRYHSRSIITEACIAAWRSGRGSAAPRHRPSYAHSSTNAHGSANKH